MNRPILVSTSLLVGLLTTISVFAAPQNFRLADYIEQVKKTSPAVAASNLQIEGTKESAKEGSFTYIPKFSVLGSYTNDKRQVTNPFYIGSVSSGDNLTFGIDQQFSSGTSAKLSYILNNSLTTGLSPIVAPSGSFRFSAGQTQLDINQPLWKNFFGIETRAAANLSEASSLASHYAEKFKLKQTLSQAETTYYRLAIAREALRLQEEVLDRSKKILDWSERRVRNQLADKSDMLQAKAAYQARQLEIETVKSEQRSAQLGFNTLRSSTSDEVGENLEPMDTASILSIQKPKRSAVTDDIKAAEQNERVIVSNNELARQKSQPDLSLFGTLAYNGVNTYLSPAVKDSFTTNHPMYVVGLKFSFPLFFLETSEIRSGRIKQQLSAESQTLQTRLNNDQNWIDLDKKFEEAKNRLKLADELVVAQKEKLDHEKYRFNLGRTTTFQVLTYEQDYSTAVITRLHIEQDLLAIHAQMKTYSEE